MCHFTVIVRELLSPKPGIHFGELLNIFNVMHVQLLGNRL
jgi:hypothetical protein